MRARGNGRASRSRPRRVAAIALTVALVSMPLSWASGTDAAGDVTPSSTQDLSPPDSYPGPPFGDLTAGTPTAQKSQSKLWFHDGSWWALMLPAGGAGVLAHELMPDHTWRPAGEVLYPATLAVGDALAVGDVVHVLRYAEPRQLRTVRLVYDQDARAYDVASDVLVAEARGSEDATLAQDGQGRLWTAWTARSRLLVTHSDPQGQAWVPPFTPTPEGQGLGPGEAASVVAFDDSVGVMWSDQARGAFHFAVHRDGEPDDVWTSETPLSGPGLADDHINLKVVQGEPDVLVAAVKTSLGDNGEPNDSPAVNVLRRSPSEGWTVTQTHTVGDQVTRPLILVDRGNRQPYLFVTAATALAVDGGQVYFKSSPVDALAFARGRGGLFVDEGPDARLNDPTSTKQEVDASTGVVVLASNLGTDTYSHAEMPLPVPSGGLPDPDDETPPSTPTGLAAAPLGTATRLSWDEASDGDGWAPAREGIPAASYVVLRDGVEVASTARTFYVDQQAPPAGTYTYEVASVDLAGNRSDRSASVVTEAPPAEAGPSVLPLAGAGAAAVLCVVVLLLRGRRR